MDRFQLRTVTMELPHAAPRFLASSIFRVENQKTAPRRAAIYSPGRLSSCILATCVEIRYIIHACSHTYVGQEILMRHIYPFWL